jgi:hypothetical protein
MKRAAWIIVPVALLSFAGCKKSPDCQKAVDHTFALLEKDLASQAPEVQAKVKEELPKQKTEALADCKAGKPNPLTAAKYDCIMAAKVKGDLDKCTGAK